MVCRDIWTSLVIQVVGRLQGAPTYATTGCHARVGTLWARNLSHSSSGHGPIHGPCFSPEAGSSGPIGVRGLLEVVDQHVYRGDRDDALGHRPIAQGCDNRCVALMVAGTSSWAGKSVVATALCASFARLGVAVAPFKAQNMSNNARVVAGGEIGSAQYFQALAARVTPTVVHNPVLLKPEAETRSQVVVLGRVDRSLMEMPWRERAAHLWDVVRRLLRPARRGGRTGCDRGGGQPRGDQPRGRRPGELANRPPRGSTDGARLRHRPRRRLRPPLRHLGAPP